MAFIDTRRRQTSSGGGGGQQTAWLIDIFPQYAPFSAGLTLNLSETPISANAVWVWSQGQLLSLDDWSASGGSIFINFSGDPAIDYPETGAWIFQVQYEYAI